jgi:hypothetical protein
MLEKHPDGRPQSAREVADALAAWLAKTADAAPTQGTAPRRQLPRRPATTAPAGQVFRSGPGSGGPSGIFGPVTTAGPGGSGVTPTPSSGVRPQTPPPWTGPTAGPAAGSPPPFRIDTSARPGGTPAAPKPAAGTKKRKDPGGLPIGLWIAIGLGLILAIVLAIAVATK